jgi:glycosyltransferase involved in cell wall biosynthesis
VPLRKIQVISIGVPLPPEQVPSEVKKVMSALPIRPSAKVIMHIGTFSAEKNQTGLLRIFSQIKKSVPEAVMILIGDGVLKESSQQLSQSLGLNDHVFFIGYQKHASAFLSYAKVFVLPSLIEGIPAVIAEASAYAIPTVAYDVGAIDEIIEDSQTGYLIPEKDETLFAERVTQLLINEDQNRILGTNALKRYHEKFPFQKIAMLFEVFYRKLLDANVILDKIRK